MLSLPPSAPEAPTSSVVIGPTPSTIGVPRSRPAAARLEVFVFTLLSKFTKVQLRRQHAAELLVLAHDIAWEQRAQRIASQQALAHADDLARFEVRAANRAAARSTSRSVISERPMRSQPAKQANRASRPAVARAASRSKQSARQAHRTDSV